MSRFPRAKTTAGQASVFLLSSKSVDSIPVRSSPLLDSHGRQPGAIQQLGQAWEAVGMSHRGQPLDVRSTTCHPGSRRDDVSFWREETSSFRDWTDLAQLWIIDGTPYYDPQVRTSSFFLGGAHRLHPVVAAPAQGDTD